MSGCGRVKGVSPVWSSLVPFSAAECLDLGSLDLSLAPRPSCLRILTAAFCKESLSP